MHPKGFWNFYSPIIKKRHALRYVIKCILPGWLIFMMIPTIRASNNLPDSAIFISQWNKAISDDLVKDGFSPVLASRAFTYPLMAGYLTAYSQNKLPYLQLNRPKVPVDSLVNSIASDSKPINIQLACITAMSEIAHAVLYHQENCNALYAYHKAYYKAIINNEELYNNSVEYGKKIALVVKRMMKSDGYEQTKSLPIYHPRINQPLLWIPTPPEFRTALEPNWKTLRPLLVKDIEPFVIQPGPELHLTDSAFLMKNARAVYDIVNNLTPEQKSIADFWDDNPDLVGMAGHIPMPRRHSSPVTHWMNITDMLCLKANKDFYESIRIHAIVAATTFDGCIITWTTKYRYNVVRPVTLINRYLSQSWLPYLVTPPFPEYTSGHSVHSAAAAEILEHFFGNNMQFTDSSVIEFGLQPRTFHSFQQAAREVSQSRVYGGIHYQFSVDYGLQQGKKIGAYIVSLIKP